MKQFQGHNHNGFTLIETLFAVLIFSAALVALMSIAGRGIAAANSAREQVVAHYLAQEGVEIVRNMRDRGEFATIETCTESDPCQVVYNEMNSAPTLQPCPGPCPSVKEMNQAFTDVGSDSIYVRRVYLIPRFPDSLGAYQEYEVISEVRWTSKAIARRVLLQTILTKWQ